MESLEISLVLSVPHFIVLALWALSKKTEYFKLGIGLISLVVIFPALIAITSGYQILSGKVVWTNEDLDGWANWDYNWALISTKLYCTYAVLNALSSFFAIRNLITELIIYNSIAFDLKGQS